MSDLDKIKKFAEKKLEKNDSAHDFEHVMRVYRNAEKICKSEKINSKLVLTSVLLHDIVSFSKNDKRSKYSSLQSARFAKRIISKMNFAEDEIKTICDFEVTGEILTLTVREEESEEFYRMYSVLKYKNKIINR